MSYQPYISEEPIPTLYEQVVYYLKTRRSLKTNTRMFYHQWLEKLKKEPLFCMPINRIKASMIKMFLSDKAAAGYSQSTLNAYYTGLIRPALELALEDELIKNNPAAFKLTTVVNKSAKKGRALTPAEENQFRRYLDQSGNRAAKNNRDLFIFALETGLRASELCGLCWSDVDRERHIVHVTKQLLVVPNQTYILDDLKTEAGIRTIPLTPNAEQCLDRAAENRSGELVFHRPNGHYISRNNLSHSYKVIADHLGFEGTTFHSLRHTYCSNLVRRGMEPKAVQYLMGHATVTTTLDVYSHLSAEEVADEFMNKIVFVHNVVDI